MTTGTKIAIVGGVLVVAYLYFSSQNPVVSATAYGATGLPLAGSPGSPIVPPNPPSSSPSLVTRVVNFDTSVIKGAVSLPIKAVGAVGSGIASGVSSAYHAIASVF